MTIPKNARSGSASQARKNNPNTKTPTKTKRSGKKMSTKPTTIRDLAQSPPTPQFELMLRGIHQYDDKGELFDGDDPADVLRRVLKRNVANIAEPVLRWNQITECCAIDIDCPDDGLAITYDELLASQDSLFPPTLPRPLASWVSHGGGLKVVFVRCGGESADALAGVWHLLADLGRMAGWRCEAKTDTRHPGGTRGAQSCSSIVWFEPCAKLTVPGNGRHSAASEEAIQNWLDEHGMTMGGRYSHDYCPINPSPSEGNPPVAVYEAGIKCFRCDADGGRSFASWDSLCGDFVQQDTPSLFEAAQNIVHLDHQVHVLRHLRPTTPDSLLAPVWGAMLRSVYQQALAAEANLTTNKNKKLTTRVDRASRPWRSGSIVRSSANTWLDASTLLPRSTISKGTMGELPWCSSLASYDRALDCLPLEGFTGLHVIGSQQVLHPEFQPPPGSIAIRRPCQLGDPPGVDIGDEPPSDEAVSAARDSLERFFPGIHVGYLATLIVAGLEAQKVGGTTLIVVVTGIPGSGKSATVRLAGAALGSGATEIHIDEDGNGTRRNLGLALESGAGLLYVDEVGRVRKAYYALQPILSLNATHRFAPKYANERTVPVNAPIVLLGSTLPDAVLGPEVCRRSVGFRLPHATRSDWRQSISDVANARRVEQIRKPLDTLTRWIWWSIQSAGPQFDWRAFCMENLQAISVELLGSDEDDKNAREDCIRKLYEIWRTSKSDEMYKGRAFGRNWLLCEPQTEGYKILSDLIDIDADPVTLKAQTSELERSELSRILGFDDPPLVLLVRKRAGMRWLVKFKQTAVMRGQGRKREDMPESRKT